MIGQTFKEAERAGWTERGAAYDCWLAAITQQANAPILDALAESYAGKRFLDICTGSGRLSADAAARGAWAEGVDFAPTMVTAAQAKHPAIPFREGDAEALPYPEASFDFAAMAFGLWHLGDPDKGLSEAYRVLRPLGRFAFTAWLPPQDGFDLMDIVLAAVREHGSLEVPMPDAPAPFRFADPHEAERTLTAIGFGDVTARRDSCLLRTSDGQDVLDLMMKSTVRAAMLVGRQERSARERILENIRDRAERYRRGDRIELRFPYLLVTATKPAA